MAVVVDALGSQLVALVGLPYPVLHWEPEVAEAADRAEKWVPLTAVLTVCRSARACPAVVTLRWTARWKPIGCSGVG